MSGAIPLLPLYACMAQTGSMYTYIYIYIYIYTAFVIEEATFNETANTQSVPYCVVAEVSMCVGRYT